MVDPSRRPKDLQALSPYHLFLLRQGAVLPPGVFQREDNYSRRRWRQIQYLADQFWKRWSREYIPLLQKRQKWKNSRRNLAVGDTVLVADETTSRSFIRLKQTDTTCWTTQTHSDELNWARRRTFHGLNSLSLDCFIKSSTFGLGLN